MVPASVRPTLACNDEGDALNKTARHACAMLIAGLAAVAIGRTASAAEITLYEHADYAGAQLTLRGWTPSIARTGFNDRASSIVVTSGRWEVCTDAEFKGFCQTFVRGEYPQLDRRLNDRISSAREVGSYGESRGSYYDYGRGAIQLFDRPGFEGASLQLAGDAATLRDSGFNDRAASVIVTQGTWELCSDAGFTGDCRTYAPGRYGELGYGMAGRIASARLLRPASDAPVVISAGAPPVPPQSIGRAILYSERGLRGTSLAVSSPVGDLERSSFNDATASMYVESGNWLACRDSFYRGDCRIFGPGRYDDLSAIGFDRVISSIRPGSDGPPPPPPLPPSQAAVPVVPVLPAPPSGVAGLELFSEPDFGGERLGVNSDMRDFERFAFNDRTASVIVHSGTWELCTDARFAGSCAVYRPGRYPHMGGLTRQVSSVRRIQ